ncbi:MAG TPA: bacteriohemerythrin [Myxococcales bacterium]|nr:bacteriohemerythrin [Myxococcales bacterium]
MAFVQWSPEYAVGVEEFDRQHQAWVALINRMHEAMRRGEGRKLVGSVLAEVVQYTRTHFLDEERAMEAARYPGLSEHRAAHAAFIRNVHQLQKAYESGDLGVSIDVADQLSGWFFRHIREMDQAYAPHLRKPGAR